MKRMFKVAAIVAVASLALVACKNNKTTEEPIDSAIEQLVEDEMIVDSPAIEDTTTIAEQVTPAPAKKTVQKAENKVSEAAVVDVEKTSEGKVVVKQKEADEVTPTSNVKRTGRR